MVTSEAEWMGEWIWECMGEWMGEGLSCEEKKGWRGWLWC